MKESFPASIYALFDDPSSSHISFVISIIIFLLIIASSFSFIIASLPKYKYPEYNGIEEGESPPFFALFEDICIICFTIEYLLRFLTVPWISWEVLTEGDERYEETGRKDSLRKWKYFALKPFNLIDFLAIVPYYFGKIGGDDGAASFSVLRILRLGRVFRIFKLGKHSRDVHIYTSVLSESAGALGLMFFFTLLTAIVFGCLMYYVEKGDWDSDQSAYVRPSAFGDTMEPSPFESIPMAMWWVFVTTTTVGYGEIYPTTTMGRIIAILCMNLGILGIALPITVIGQNFAEVFAKQGAMKEQNDLHQRNNDIHNMVVDMEVKLREIKTLISIQGDELQLMKNQSQI